MKVLITRSRSQADDFAAKLRTAGFEPIFFPVIEICPVEDTSELTAALCDLSSYEWVVFTSVNAVEVVFQALERLQDIVSLLHVAAIGPKTAEALRRHNVQPDFVPDEYIAEAIFSGLGDVKNKKILFPRAEIARKELPEAINRAGGFAHEVVVYRTLPAEVDMNGLHALKNGVDIITFTSASTVEYFIAICTQNGLDPLNLPNNPLFACIGPITEQSAREAGIQNLLVAQEYTTDGLIQTITKTETL